MKKLDLQKLSENIDAAARYDLENNNLFGSAYVVYQGGKTVFEKYYGSSDSKGEVKMTDKTLFRLASMTKPISAVATLILVDRGLISLDDPVKKYLSKLADVHVITPEGVDMGKTPVDVTVLHLLTHTSGIGSLKSITLSDEEAATIEGSVDRFISEGLDFTPFSRSWYSGFAAFDVLAAVIEKVTGESLYEFMKREIFVPCDMPDTTFSPSEEQWSRMATMHTKTDGKNDIGSPNGRTIFESFPCTHALAGAGLASTMHDYVNFAKMLLNKGKTDKGALMREEIFSLMSTPQVPKEIQGGYERWGLGVRVITEEAYKALPVGAFGWSGAYGSHFWIDPENDLFAVFLKNSRFDGGAGNCSARRLELAVCNALV